MRSVLDNKKGQMEYSIITFIVLIIGLLIMAPFILKIFNSFLTPFASAVGNQTAEAGVNVLHVKNTFISFWDWVIVMAFVVNLVLLLISAFLVDVHPAFLILFIIFGFLSFVFAPEILQVVDSIYSNGQLSLEVSQIAMLDFIREYFSLIMLSIWFIVGIIVYAKFRYGDR